jgi:hypothetical protein
MLFGLVAFQVWAEPELPVFKRWQPKATKEINAAWCQNWSPKQAKLREYLKGVYQHYHLVDSTTRSGFRTKTCDGLGKKNDGAAASNCYDSFKPSLD